MSILQLKNLPLHILHDVEACLLLLSVLVSAMQKGTKYKYFLYLIQSGQAAIMTFFYIFLLKMNKSEQ